MSSDRFDHNTPLRDDRGEIMGTPSSGEDITERRWMDRRLEAVLRTTRDGFLVVDHQGRIQDVNESLAQMLGYTTNELLTMSIPDLEVMETAAEVSQHIEKIREQNHDRFESQLRRRDGEIIDIEASASYLDTDRQQIFTFIHDITERKRSERALRKLAYDLGERVKELNCLHGISDLVEAPGIRLEEIVKGTVDLIPVAWQYPEVTYARIVLEGQEFSTENFSHSPWQQKADILAHGEQIGAVQVGYLQEMPASDEGPFRKEERDLLNTIARRMGEISERMQGQQKLLQQHQFLQNILDSLPHPFYVINTQDRTVEMANSAAFAGRLHEKSTCHVLVHGHDHPCERDKDGCPLYEVMRTKGPVVVEHVHTEGDGGRLDVEVHGYPVVDQDGNVVQMIEYALDITQRKKAEQAQRESEARWRSLTETSPDHILMLDTELKIQFANFAPPGLTVDELIGTPLYTLVDRDRQAEIKTLLENAVETGTPNRYETVYHPPDGDDIHYESRVAPRTLSGSENVVGLTVSARDITERKRAERALRDSEEKLRALFEILPVGISVLDDSREIQFANRALARILRLSQDQLQSGEYEERTYLRSDGTEMPPDEFPSYRVFREQQLVRDVEICVVLEDGERVWTSVSAVPLPSGNWRAIITTIDITDRKRAEMALSKARDELELRVEERTAELRSLNISLLAEIAERQRAEGELRASEERFRQLAENTEDIILLMEPDSGRLLYVSPAYERLLGRSGRSIPQRIDQLWADVHPDDLGLIPRDRVDTWIGEEIEFRITASGGKLHWIRARVFPVRDETGHVYRLVGIASDITEQKQAYAAVIEAEQLAIAGRMAASLAHEINNPLQAAIGCLDLGMEQLDQGKDPNRHLQVTNEALARASRVVAQLRALHYPMDTERKEALDINKLLENMLVLVQKRCIDQQVEVDWQATPDLPPVPLMPDAIQQVFLNLLLNALDAMPQGGRLQISTGQTQDPAGIQIRCSDSGGGIPADGIERVFEPFYSTKSNSLGLGLFISHNIVQEHRGNIEVHSREGKGTTFSIWLPLSSQEVDQ
jgi:PAS domain S-box-containing protein